MREHISVFSLFARCSIFKVLGVLAVMAAAETGVFLWAMQSETFLETAFDTARLELLFTAAFLWVSLLLLRAASVEKVRYTLYRLQIPRGSVFLCQTLYNVCVYLLLWLVQAAIAVLLCKYFLSQSQEAGSQDFVLAVYRQPFLHSLLPMAERTLWVRNLLLAAALGVSTAHFAQRRRMGTVSYFIIPPTICGAMFVNGLGLTGGEIMSICASVCVVVGVIYEIYANEELSV